MTIFKYKKPEQKKPHAWWILQLTLWLIGTEARPKTRITPRCHPTRNTSRGWKQLTKPGVCIVHIVLIQSCKVNADVWDIKRITGFWLRHLHSHTVPKSPLSAVPQPFRQQQGISGIIPHLSSSAEFPGTGIGISPLLALHTFGQNSSWAMQSFILLLICKAKDISPLLTFAGSKLSERSSFDGIFSVPVGARIVFFKE